MLFDRLPEYPPALPDDELKLLADLPEWPTEQEVDDVDHGTARRLERKGLIKISRQLLDPAGSMRTWFAGKLPAALVRQT